MTEPMHHEALQPAGLPVCHHVLSDGTSPWYFYCHELETATLHRPGRPNYHPFVTALDVLEGRAPGVPFRSA